MGTDWRRLFRRLGLLTLVVALLVTPALAGDDDDKKSDGWKYSKLAKLLQKLKHKRFAKFKDWITPTNVAIEVDLPLWLAEPAGAFRVSYDGITDVALEDAGEGVVSFSNSVTVNDLVVIARDAETRRRAEATLAEMQALLERARTSEPVHTDEPSPYED